MNETVESLTGEINNLTSRIDRQVRIMEVCGTHTVSLRRSGIHSLLPESVRLVSGPGCPVCVTPASYIDNALSLVESEDTIVATFGDMVKVPGASGHSLSRFLGSGKVRILYSPSQLISVCEEASRFSPPKNVVFLAIGFETTIPTVISGLRQCIDGGVENLYLYTAFRTVPPALKTLLASNDHGIDGFILPGHVSVIIGVQAYRFLDHLGVPGVVTGFEPDEMLRGIRSVLRLLVRQRPELVINEYPAAVRDSGNRKAREIMDRYLEPCDALWRGLGMIPESGLRLRPEYRDYDAEFAFSLQPLRNDEPAGCLCGEVIQGKKLPTECRHFGTTCTPDNPVGPCMVSSEGTCAAYLRYGSVRV